MPSKYLSKLQGSSVVIVGGSSGIGYGIAEAVLEHGASVAVASRSRSKVDDAVKQLQNTYPDHASKVRGHTVDLNALETSTEEQLVKLFNFVSENGKTPVDHVVETAGDLSLRGKLTLATATTELMAQATSTRYMGVVLLAKVATRYLKKEHTSSFTMTSGAMLYKPVPGVAPMMGGGGGKDPMTRGLAIDVAPIRVNLVVPGAIETDLLYGGADTQEQRDGMRKMYAEHCLLKRVGDVEDIVEMYLASMKSGFLTGSILQCEGGYYLS